MCLGRVKIYALQGNRLTSSFRKQKIAKTLEIEWIYKTQSRSLDSHYYKLSEKSPMVSRQTESYAILCQRFFSASDIRMKMTATER